MKNGSLYGVQWSVAGLLGSRDRRDARNASDGEPRWYNERRYIMRVESQAMAVSTAGSRRRCGESERRMKGTAGKKAHSCS